MDGWIKLHRKLLDNPIVCKDGETLAIWLYLLLNATHKEKDVLFKGKRITLKPGQLLTNKQKIADALMINESKVKRTIQMFVLEQQIDQQTSNKNRVISILNWDKYQCSDSPNDPQVTYKKLNQKDKNKKSHKKGDPQPDNWNAVLPTNTSDDGWRSDLQMTYNRPTSDPQVTHYKQECKEYNNINNIYAQGKEQNAQQVERTGKQPEWEIQFEQFWKQYPRKRSKQRARDWFKKHKPNSELFSLILTQLEQFKGTAEWIKDHGQFIPYPTTWLNQERWEDEITSEDMSTTRNAMTEIDELLKKYEEEENENLEK